MLSFLMLLFFVISTIVSESVILYLQYKFNLMDRLFKKKAFFVHSIVVIGFWSFSSLLFLMYQTQDHISLHESQILVIFGLFIFFFGITVATWGFLILGLRKSLGYNFFAGDQTIINHSIYNYIKNPEEHGFILMMFGVSLFTDSLQNFAIAVAILIFMIPHQKIENFPLQKH